MKRLLFLVLFATAFVAAMVAPKAADAAVFPCYGAPADYRAAFDGSDGTVDGEVSYPQPRTYIAAQEWWEAEEFGLSGFEGGHIHLEGCVPVDNQVISGIFKFDGKAMLHNSPGRFNTVSVRIDTSTFILPGTGLPGGQMTCAVTCTRFFHIEADTRNFANDGLHSLRIMGMGPSGETIGGVAQSHRTILRTAVNIQNGKPESNGPSEAQHLEGCGWYTAPVEYACAELKSPLSQAPIVGTRSYTVEWHKQTTTLPVVRRFATVDADFHNADPALRQGKVLINQTMNASNFTGTVTIDPAALGLAPGLHRLFLRADVKNSTGDNINAGALVIPFTVGG